MTFDERVNQIIDRITKQREIYPSVEDFIPAISNALYGSSCGGNPESPIWLCALEQGGFDEKNVFEDFKVRDKDKVESAKNWWKDAETMKDWLNGVFVKKGKKGGTIFYRSQVSLLTAIIEGKNKVTQERNPHCWLKEYKFYCEGCYGFALNAFPIAITGHNDDCWNKDKLVKLTNSEDDNISFKDWLGIPFGEYLDLSVALRRKGFGELRKEYHPALIYCGGYSEYSRLFRLWNDDSEELGERVFTIGKNNYKCRVRHLSYEDKTGQRRDTFVATGPFFGRPLNSYANRGELGEKLRNLCNAYFRGDSWLRKEDFPPFKSVKDS